MHIESCRPLLLPLKYDYTPAIPLLGKARALIERFNIELSQEKNAKAILEPILWSETFASLRLKKNEWEKLFQYKTRKIIHPSDRFDKTIDDHTALRIALHWKRPVNISFYCHLHRIIKQHKPSQQDVGHIRDRQNWIGKAGCKIEKAYFYPPAPNRVEPLLKNLNQYLQEKAEDPLLQIAIFFAQFLIIHPFMDGNGRIARMMIPLLSERKKLLKYPALTLSHYFQSHRSQYFQKLFFISQKNAWNEWLEFFLKGCIDEVQKNRKKFQRLQKLFSETAALIGEKKAKHLFLQPVVKKIDLRSQKLIKKKILIAQENGYLFKPLIHAIRD